MSTAYHPQTDGQTERANRTLEEMLRARINFAQDDWDEHLAAAELAINNAKQASTGYSPFYLNYGQQVRLPLDNELAAAAPDCNNPAADERIRRLHDDIARARTHIEAAQQRQKHYADQHRRDVQFAVGDLVLLSTQHLRLAGNESRAAKLSSPFIGPFKISRFVNDNAYELDLPPSLQIHPVINITRLKAYRDGSQLFPSRPPPDSRPPAEITDDGEEAYEVEEIMGRRGSGTRREYLVKWRGYPQWEWTWEPQRNLQNAADAVAAFEAKLRRNSSRGRAGS